jgi:arylsulfatase A-like enzyme
MARKLRQRSTIHGSTVLGAFLLQGVTGCSQSAPLPGAGPDSEVGSSVETLSQKCGAKKPNILLILADDLGYSDLGAMGSEISTPNLDALVGEGRLLTNHHVATVSAPTRSMLLSGTDHHLVGEGQMQLALFPDLAGLPGYEGYLNDRSLSVADLLHDAGYHTYTAGKWHLGASIAGGPANKGFTPDHWGFEHSYSVIAGGVANQFGREAAGSSNYVADGVYVQPGQPGQPGGEGGTPANYYTTDFFTQKLIEFIDGGHGDGKPFFAYAAYTSPHWPLQVPEPWLSMYAGKYDGGYDAIRAKRIDRLRALHLIDKKATIAETAPEMLTPEPASPNYNTSTSMYINALHGAEDGYVDHHAGIVDKKWGSLSDLEKKAQSRYMEIYAGMVSNLDHNIGLLIQHLKDIGEYDNTFIMFHSDNGPDGWPMSSTDPKSVDEGYAVDPAYSTLGTIDAPARAPFGIQYGRRWAEVCATPLAMTKGFTAEGGITTAAIVKMPGQSRPLKPYTRFTHVTDDTATILEVAGVTPPTDTYKGRTVYPVTGHSLVKLFSSNTQSPIWNEPFGEELYGRTASFSSDGQWKARFIEPTFGPADGHWQLFNIAQDIGETKDLSAEEPDILAELVANWEAYMARVGGVEPREALGYYPPRPAR